MHLWEKNRQKGCFFAHKKDERHNVQMGTTTLFSYQIDAKSSNLRLYNNVQNAYEMRKSMSSTILV